MKNKFVKRIVLLLCLSACLTSCGKSENVENNESLITEIEQTDIAEENVSDVSEPEEAKEDSQSEETTKTERTLLYEKEYKCLTGSVKFEWLLDRYEDSVINASCTCDSMNDATAAFGGIFLFLNDADCKYMISVHVKDSDAYFVFSKLTETAVVIGAEEDGTSCYSLPSWVDLENINEEVAKEFSQCLQTFASESLEIIEN